MKRILSNALLTFFFLGFVATVWLSLSVANTLNSYSSNWSLVFLTGAYVVLTYLILDSNNQIKEITNRPYIVFSLPQQKRVVFLKIENIGKTPAYDLTIDVYPKLETIEYEGMKNSTFLKQSYLRPNELISHPVAPISNLLEKNKKESVFDVAIRYKDHKGKEFKENYKIDTTNYVFKERAINFNQT